MSSVPPDPLSAPLRLVIDLTGRCNLRCAYCCFFSNPDESSRADMPVDRWVDLIDDAGRCGVLQLILRGGEALLSPAFRPVVESAVRNRMRFSFLTNGKLFTEDTARWIAATGRCDMVKISLDGPEDVHDPVRGRGSHAAALRAMEIARAAGLKLKVTCAVHRFNWRRLPEIVSYMVDELKLSNVSFSAVTYCEASEYMLSEADFRGAVDMLCRHARPEMSGGGMVGGIRRWRAMLKGTAACGECRLLYSRMGVLPDGSFVPCVTLSGVLLGRAGRESVAEAWAALKARPELGRREYPDPGCASCRYSQVCRGVCRGLLDSEIGGDWRYFCLRRHLESPWGGSL